jgi:hypothetical protein
MVLIKVFDYSWIKPLLLLSSLKITPLRIIMAHNFICKQNPVRTPKVLLCQANFNFKPLPKHLTLQLDNFSKDNKNQTMLAFESDLVAWGIFETVTFFFLLVGNIYEDIDACFSKVAKQTRKKDICRMLLQPIMKFNVLGATNPGTNLPGTLCFNVDCTFYADNKYRSKQDRAES